MVVHHPAYQNKVFMVFADSVILGSDIPKDMQPAIRGQMKDYPKSKLKELIPFPGGKPINKDIEDMDLLNEYGKFGTVDALVEALKINTTITPMSLSQRRIENDGGVNALADALKTRTTIASMNISRIGSTMVVFTLLQNMGKDTPQPS